MSDEQATVVDGVSYSHRLPRGRHGIPQELVEAHQRERMLAAATAILVEKGYASLSVSDVIKQARVSRGTFYDIFENKRDCVLAAQRRAFERLNEAIDAACSSEQDWPRAVAAAVGAALDFAVQSPDEASFILASGHVSSEPKLARQGLALHQRLVELLRQGSRGYPSARSPGALAERAAVGAAMSIVGSCFATEETDALPKLRADLAQIILTPYLGANEAKRVAQAV